MACGGVCVACAMCLMRRGTQAFAERYKAVMDMSQNALNEDTTEMVCACVHPPFVWRCRPHAHCLA